jgi:peptide/nickel transport system permease protein
MISPPPTVTGLYTIDSLLVGEWGTLLDALAHLILPTFALAWARLAVVVRVTRRSVLQVLGEDYVRTARAKGLGNRRVVGRHVLKNALIPVVTIVGLQFGWLLGGTVLVEVIFGWPGVGRYALEAIGFLDFPAIMGVTLTVSLMFVVLNLIVDVLYTLIDPRIQY